MKEKNRKQSIYAIKNVDTGKIKIGITENIENRLSGLISSSGCNMQLICHSCKIENAKIVENEIHYFFKDKKYIGEWFDISESDAKYAIEKACAGKKLSLNENDNHIERLDSIQFTRYKRINKGIYVDKFGIFYSIEYKNKKWEVQKLQKID